MPQEPIVTNVERDNANAVTSSRVIPVSDVTPATDALDETLYTNAIEALSLVYGPPNRSTGLPESLVLPFKTVEACSHYDRPLVADVRVHPVISALHLAFKDHRPCALSPDMVWLMIAQGFAAHINANAEAMRWRVVSHEGKAEIKIRRDDFIKGMPDNPWPEVFDAFTEQVRQHIRETVYDLVLPDFSTTGPTERAAAQIALLNAVKAYFTYSMDTLCGIPQITLEGTAGDWEKLAEKAQALGQFGLDQWVGVLTPILNEIAASARGQVKQTFWQSIYKWKEESGGPYITGWITAFFPYFKDKTGAAVVPNPWLARGGDALQALLYPPEKRDPNQLGYGLKAEYVPNGLASAPFDWNVLAETFKMEFLGGFVGVRQDAETLCLRPEIGWAVCEAS